MGVLLTSSKIVFKGANFRTTPNIPTLPRDATTTLVILLIHITGFLSISDLVQLDNDLKLT
ncbi:hypothetical protein LC605_32755 [Nostoc sp. CHAB 5836]|uniref:hypothetical protein n=1 Tax=Nostoc sp. CHAB 5836 TaxID=2780404 RepID=UPI001E3929CE|nr:hypothetical protein [Nostoc sp. CHAB 5836]MCC5619712.1 hypothetical protein [Nostoc sp. CHAB 5836]